MALAEQHPTEWPWQAKLPYAFPQDSQGIFSLVSSPAVSSFPLLPPASKDLSAKSALV